jgi:DNA polymerase-3 subunit epsilon
LSPQSDRIVEIAIARIEPGEAPKLVLDTLVNPQRRVSCSEIHGIYDDDVIGAPLFGELAAPIAAALDGAAIASFNVYFDMRFLDSELPSARIPTPLPHLCLMWLRPALGLGARASLVETCKDMGHPFTSEHRAATDVMAAASLWSHYVEAATSQSVHTFADVSKLRDYKFMKSWTQRPITRADFSDRKLTTALKPRRGRSSDATPSTPQVKARTAQERQAQQMQQALSNYWQALTAALVDFEVTAAEFTNLRELQQAPGLNTDAIRYVHGRVVAGLLDEMTKDLRIDDAEAAWLGHVSNILRELGWAPGDSSRNTGGSTTVPVASMRSLDRFESKAGWWQKLFG